MEVMTEIKLLSFSAVMKRKPRGQHGPHAAGSESVQADTYIHSRHLEMTIKSLQKRRDLPMVQIELSTSTPLFPIALIFNANEKKIRHEDEI
jgi:hypothetical protein